MRSNPNLSKDDLKKLLNHLIETEFGEELKNIPAEQRERAIDKYVDELTQNGDFPRDELTPRKMVELAQGITIKLAFENNPLTFTAEEKAFIEERRKPENADKPLTAEEQKLADSIEKKLDGMQSAIAGALAKNNMLKPSSESVIPEEGLGEAFFGFHFEPDDEPNIKDNGIVTIRETNRKTPKPSGKSDSEDEEEEEEEKDLEAAPSKKKKKSFMERLEGVTLEDPGSTSVQVIAGSFFNFDFNPNHSKNLSQIPSQDRMEQIVLGNLQFAYETNYERAHQDKNMAEYLHDEGIISGRYDLRPRPY